MKTLILIPSRLSATRLPRKPLLKINGLSIISHVFKKAVEANIGEVYVAAEDQEIINDINKNGGQAILTSDTHKTGTDRIHEALKKIGKTDIDLVMNLQGDEPLINVEDIRNLHEQMIKTNFEIGTLASKIFDKNSLKNKNVVKVITQESLDISKFPKAINFTRKSNVPGENVYHHLGIYCYRTESLIKFVSLKQTNNEVKNKLEQLRALDNNIQINVARANSNPIGLDTQEDFVAIKKIMEYKT
tara:strand:- start:9499 stop:10233 length:735 start_codon:yes stop_codon:yes gene_type:complete